MRVVAGRFAGRSLDSPRGAATRPTTGRVREALFSILGSLLGCRVLDLYSGSGALGIEALSRGAERVVLVESARPALACIHRNLSRLGIAEEVTVVPARVERSRERLESLGPFDLVLCDPPWAKIERCAADVAKLLQGKSVTSDATLVVEHPARLTIQEVEPIAGPPFDRRIYGDTGLSLFRISPRS